MYGLRRVVQGYEADANESNTQGNLMKHIVAVLFLILTMVVPISGQDWSKVYERVYFDHLIELVDELGSCGGVAVGEQLFVTVDHCISPNLSMFAKDQFGHSVPATVLVTNPSIDLALVRSTVSGKKPIRYAAESPKRGSPVMAIGYPRDTPFPSVTPSYVHSVENGVILVTQSNLPGYSGGPLVNYKGELVGINKGYYPNYNIGIAIMVETVQLFVKLNQK